MLCDIFIDERKYRYTLIDHQDVVNQRICLNRMNDLIDGTKMTGSVIIDGVDIYGKTRMLMLCVKRRDGFSKTKSTKDYL
jgi:hypothetical protein